MTGNGGGGGGGGGDTQGFPLNITDFNSEFLWLNDKHFKQEMNSVQLAIDHTQ